MLKQTKRVLATAAMMAMVACSPQMQTATPPPTTSGPYIIHTTNSAAPLVDSLLATYNETSEAYHFISSPGNHAQLMTALQAQEVDYFISHHRPNSDNIWAAPIAQDGIIAIVHPDNVVTNLTITQLRQIYQGYITNWEDLGGDNQAITLYSRESGSGIRAEFEHLVMGQRVTSPNAQIVPSTEAAITRVMADPGGLAYVPLSQVTDTVHALAIDDVTPAQETVAEQVYPLRTTLFIIGRQEPEAPYATLIAWIQSIAGQAIVAEDFVPLHR